MILGLFRSAGSRHSNSDLLYSIVAASKTTLKRYLNGYDTKDVVASKDTQKTLVTNSADIQYAKWQHAAGIEKVFTYYTWRWSVSTWKGWVKVMSSICLRRGLIGKVTGGGGAKKAKSDSMASQTLKWVFRHKTKMPHKNWEKGAGGKGNPRVHSRYLTIIKEAPVGVRGGGPRGGWGDGLHSRYSLKQTTSHATLRQTERRLWLVRDCSHGFKKKKNNYRATFNRLSYFLSPALTHPWILMYQ